jgi:hypothetical protein
MASVRIPLRLAPRRIVQVDVCDAECPLLGCFSPALHETRVAGASGARTRTFTWECWHRDQRGCPAPEARVVVGGYRRRGGAWEGA